MKVERTLAGIGPSERPEDIHLAFATLAAAHMCTRQIVRSG